MAKKLQTNDEQQTKPAAPLGFDDDGPGGAADSSGGRSTTADAAELPAVPTGGAGPDSESLPAGAVKVLAGELRPYCELHNVLMVAYSTRETVSYYRCPVATCKCRAKRARPQLKVPTAPTLCPQRCCEKKKPALEVNPRFSQGLYLRMQCPDCGFHTNAPKPHVGDTLPTRSPRSAHDGELAAR